MGVLLEARDVGMTFRRSGPFPGAAVPALDGFSMRIDDARARFTAVAGESGSGKTTIARLLLGLLSPSRGTVLYRGQDVRALPRQRMMEYRRDVQAVFQDPFEVYNPFYRVDRMLTAPVRKFGLARSGAEARTRIADALHSVGLRPEETLGRYPHQLSGGQRQRVTIARALLLRPRVIVADEPVSMVDASLRASIMGVLHGLYRDRNLSFVYITHDLTTACHVSDNLVVLYRGRVVEAGPTDPIIRSPMHPYTDALIRSIPAAQPGREWIEGAQEPVAEESASPARAGAGGCAYAARCPHATDRCRARAPGLYATREGTASACFLREAGAAIDGPGLADLLRG